MYMKEHTKYVYKSNPFFIWLKNKIDNLPYSTFILVTRSNRPTDVVHAARYVVKLNTNITQLIAGRVKL